MKATEIRIRNLGLIPDLKATLPSSGLVLVKAKNEKGKSTFIRSLATMLAAKTPDNMLTIGETNGFVEQRFTAANGDEYVLRMDLDPANTKDRFTLMNPTGKVSKRISEVKDIFLYNDFTVEDFMDWGKTEDGGRKQANVVLKMLSEADQKQFKSLSEEEKSVYEERKLTGRERDRKRATVIEPTTEEKQENDLYPALLEQREELETKLKSFDECALVEQHISHLEEKQADSDRRIADLRVAYKNSTDEIERLEALIAEEKVKQAKIKQAGIDENAALAKIVKEIESEKKLLESMDASQRDVIQTQLEELDKHIDEARTCKDKIDCYVKAKEEYDGLVKKYEEGTARIEEIRFSKKKILSQELPVSNLVIDDGILYYEKDGDRKSVV